MTNFSEEPNLIQKFSLLERANYLNSFKTADIYALNLLQPLLNGYSVLPFSGSSLRPFCLVHIINDIIINGRKNIIEFGSGISSIMIGRLIKKNKLGSTLISIEHDENWVNVLNNILKNEQIDDIVKIIHVPLSECNIALDNNQWYELELLRKFTRNKKFDMVIIDGPPAWEETKTRARYPAVPFISNKLNENFSIYLDDTIRAGEKNIVKIWAKEYGIQFNITGKSLAYYYGGKAFYTEPFLYY